MSSKGTETGVIFNNRGKNYSKYRPSYPSSIIEFLNEEIGLNKECVIADIGSGTGICTKMFLDNGNSVYGIEPNKEMRQEAEWFLKTYKNFCSIDGSSEDTKLKSESVDVITVAQAFHWFRPEPTKQEFLRILKQNSSIVLMWNIRKSKSYGFMREYIDIIRKYREESNIKSDENIIPKFFDNKKVCEKVFSNPQEYDFERLKGELISYSYIPNEGDSRYNMMLSKLEDLFEKYNDDGKVILEYETRVYYCRIK